MFGFDNKAGVDPAAVQEPTGAPTVPNDNAMAVSQPSETQMAGPATSFDGGADEGTMNDDMASSAPVVPPESTDTSEPSDSADPVPTSTFHQASEDTTNDTPLAAPATGTMSTDDLLHLKQQALQQLSPLVGHLDQSPEEKFKTTMMMIQASDDQSLVPSAYEAANAITDEKVKAQALLDIVNEINYFTQHHNN